MRSSDDGLVVDAFVEWAALSVMCGCLSTLSRPRHQESQSLAIPRVACGPLNVGEQLAALWTACDVSGACVQHPSARGS
jgi:hypothetical protein